MTSNVGSQYILNAPFDHDDDRSEENSYETMKQRVLDAARSVFRPEFMNRVDEYIVFRPLDRDQIKSIVRLQVFYFIILTNGHWQVLTWRVQLERVQRRVADRKLTITVNDAAVQLLAKLGYDPNYGARPVKRVIQQHVENELAKGILRGDFGDEDTILVDTEVTAFANGQLPQERLVFRKLAPPRSLSGQPAAEGEDRRAQFSERS